MLGTLQFLRATGYVLPRIFSTPFFFVRRVDPLETSCNRFHCGIFRNRSQTRFAVATSLIPKY